MVATANIIINGAEINSLMKHNIIGEMTFEFNGTLENMQNPAFNN
jgi:hypothetical protein